MCDKLIFFVRHGKTDANNDHYYLQGMDLALNVIGENMAKQTGQFFAKHYEIQNIFHSEKIRTKQTAQIIADQLKFKKNLIQSEYINECNHNSLIGIEKQKITKQVQQIFNKRVTKADRSDHIFVKQELTNIRLNLISQLGAETVQSIQKRVAKFIKQLLKVRGNTIVVSHKGLIRNTVQYLCNFTQSADNTESGSYCSITVFQQKKNKLYLVYQTSTQHLTPN